MVVRSASSWYGEHQAFITDKRARRASCHVFAQLRPLLVVSGAVIRSAVGSFDDIVQLRFSFDAARARGPLQLVCTVRFVIAPFLDLYVWDMS